MLKEMMRHIEGTTNTGQIMFVLATSIFEAVDAYLICSSRWGSLLRTLDGSLVPLSRVVSKYI